MINLLVQDAPLSLHNEARRIGGDFEFFTASARWAYAVSLPVTVATAPDPSLRPLVVVELQVLEGCVGVGVLDDTMQRFVTPEVDRASGGATRVEVRLDAGAGHRHLMIRNTASQVSRFRLLAVHLRYAAADQALLQALPCPAVDAVVYQRPATLATFDVFISHSSRRWYAEQCERGYLRARYASTERFRDLPPFDSLPPNTAPYHGLLSLFRIELSEAGVAGRLLRHYISTEKLVHAAVMDEHVVVCFEAGVAVVSAQPFEADGLDLDPRSAERIDDPWFGGIHTVVAENERVCLVSSSGADAVLWLDVPTRKVVRRWRLPADRYGHNYALDEHTWLSQHYIANDVQLGHLNCAAPDGLGGVFVSVLGQGDIGHVDASGRYRLITSGQIGCHGVRYSAGHDLLYFCNSCAGTLLAVGRAGDVTTLFDAGSRWLHDGVHLIDNLFLLTLGDRNALVLADARRGRIADWDFSASEGTVQFLSVAGRVGA